MDGWMERRERGARSSITWSMIRREVEVNRSNGISWKRCEREEGEGRRNEWTNEWDARNEWIDQRAEWLNRFIWQIRLADRDCLFILFYFILFRFILFYMYIYIYIRIKRGKDFCDQTFTIDFSRMVIPCYSIGLGLKKLFDFFFQRNSLSNPLQLMIDRI